MALHSELLMELIYVLLMDPLKVPIMENLWVYFLVIHLDKIIDMSWALHMVLFMVWL